MIQGWNDLAGLWITHLGAAAWQSTVVAVLVLVAVRFGRHWPAPLRHGLTVLALLKFAIPATLTLPTSVQQLAPPPASIAIESRPAQLPLPPLPAMRPIGSDAASSTLEFTPPAPRPSAAAGAFALFLCGALTMCARVTMEAMRLRRLAYRAKPVLDGPLHAQLAELCRTLGLRRRPRLLLFGGDAVPCAFGLFAPTILLPDRLVRELSPARLRLVLAHELAHHRRGDLWVNALQTGLAVVWWFDPFYWLLGRQVRSTREDSCDDVAIAGATGDRTIYCEILLQAARIGTRSPFAVAGLACRFGTHPLRRRLSRIMRPRFQPSSRLRPLHALGLVALAFTLLPGATRSLEQRPPAPEPRVVESAVHELESADPVVRATAARTLGEAQAFESIPRLVQLMADETPIPELPAWRGAHQWSPALSTWSQPSPGETAAIALASMSAGAVPALIDALSDPRPAVRRNAAWALGESHSPRLLHLPEVAALIGALQDSDSGVRAAAAWSLGETKSRDATAALSIALHDADANVRRHAAHALGEICDPSTSDALLAALSDPNAGTRKAAAWALEEIADRLGDEVRRHGD